MIASPLSAALTIPMNICPDDWKRNGITGARWRGSGQDILLGWKNLPGQSAARRWWKRRHRPEENHKPGEAQALFIWRDNADHRDAIERHYLKMLANAKREVIIANAYFFPGYRLLHAMRNAARRGVRVKLIVQGEPDMPIIKIGARLLYDYLVKGGVQIYEYRRRPLHGKVAIMDDHWATVGSRHLDPLSLSLNLEAKSYRPRSGVQSNAAD